jgi:hypothetical protein
VGTDSPQGDMILCQNYASHITDIEGLPVGNLSAMLRRAAREVGLVLPSRLPSARPNTTIGFCLYDATSAPAAPSPLTLGAWEQLLEGYPGALQHDIMGMISYGAKLAYAGELRHRSRRLETNLPMDDGGEIHVDQEMRERVRAGAVQLPESNERVVCSPLGAVPKPAVDGVLKCRTIHHLSWPRKARNESSVNEGIDSDLVTLKYYNLDCMLRELGRES